jgi:hypothetical protein
MAKGVQFRGIDAVMKLFANMELSAWSLMYEKNLVCKFPSKLTGDTQSFEDSKHTLLEILRGLQNGESYAVYTLRLYEQLPKGGIKPSTEPDYSYNFTLFERENYEQWRGERSPSVMSKLEERLIAIEAKLNEGDGDEEKEQVGGIAGFFNALVENDRFKNKIQDIFFSLADKIFEEGKPGNLYPVRGASPQPPARVGLVNENSPVLLDDAQVKKCSDAIEILARIDPNLGDNLLRIAESASKDQGNYHDLIKMLNKFL